jgi:hypothetical protein
MITEVPETEEQKPPELQVLITYDPATCAFAASWKVPNLELALAMVRWLEDELKWQCNVLWAARHQSRIQMVSGFDGAAKIGRS